MTGYDHFWYGSKKESYNLQCGPYNIFASWVGSSAQKVVHQCSALTDDKWDILFFFMIG